MTMGRSGNGQDLITAILRPTPSDLPLDTNRGWAKIMDLRPRYQALFLPDAHLWRFRGLAIVTTKEVYSCPRPMLY